MCSGFIPGISLASEDSLHESLRWHPFDWQHGTTAFPVIAGSGKEKKKKSNLGMSTYHQYRSIEI